MYSRGAVNPPRSRREQSEVIILKLRGEVLGKPVVKAVTAQSKPKCTTCGRNNKGTARFCAQCGTALQLI